MDHPDVLEDEVKLSLEKPLKIVDMTNNKYFYYQYFKYKKSPAKFLKTIVRYLNDEGFVITSHFVKDMR